MRRRGRAAAWGVVAGSTAVFAAASLLGPMTTDSNAVLDGTWVASGGLAASLGLGLTITHVGGRR
ncbi:MAG: hypothetical protein KTR31_18550 [Myxococcales bacterium]|nr:hypothetical protein [Myxococcales bacterium]